MAALSHLRRISVFTHDSIGVGEDGPTHQPIEHLAALRVIPNVVDLRPADANEVREAWIVAIEEQHRPSALVLTRQNLPTLDRTTSPSSVGAEEGSRGWGLPLYAPASGLRRGAYVLADLAPAEAPAPPQIILMASGSEVGLIVEAGKRLAEQGLAVRLVSFPSWRLFGEQDAAYQDAVLPPDITTRLSVEAGVTLGWHRWVGSQGCVLGIDRYGASAPATTVFKNLGLTVDHIVEVALKMVPKGNNL